MATVINNPTSSERVVERESGNGAAWAVAVIILLVLVAIGGFLWFRAGGAPAAPADTGGGANINVTLPDVNSGGGGGSGGGAAPSGGPAQ